VTRCSLFLKGAGVPIVPNIRYIGGVTARTQGRRRSPAAERLEYGGSLRIRVGERNCRVAKLEMTRFS